MNKPHLLFFSAKWHACKPDNGPSNAESILWGPFSATGLGTFECFLSDEEHQKTGQPCDNALIRRCSEIRPDILVLAWMPSAPENINPKLSTLETIRNVLNIPIVAIWYDTWADWVPRLVDTITPLVDVSIIADSLLHFEKSPFKDRYLHLFHPADIRVFNDPELERDIDISFNVGIRGLSDRISGLGALAAAGIHVVKSGGQLEHPLPLEEYARVFKRSKISLNFSLSGDKPTLKGRLLEATLCGSMLLETWNSETPKWFKPMVEYVPFTCEKDLVEKARYYLAHDAERAAIALRGREKARRIGNGKIFWGAIIAAVEKARNPHRIENSGSVEYSAPLLQSGAMPLVSIFDFCKNAKKTIRRSLNSLVEVFKIYPNIEVVIQDGGSTDGTLDIIGEYAPVFGERLKLVSQPDSCAGEGFLRAMRRCNGDIVCSCLSDEELFPYAVQWAVEKFSESQEAAVVHGDMYNTDINGNIVVHNPSREFNLASYLAHELPMHFAASFFRKSALEEIGLYSDDWLVTGGDFEIWSRLGRSSQKICYFPIVLAKYAVHEGELSECPEQISKRFGYREKIIRETLEALNKSEYVWLQRTEILYKFYVYAIKTLHRMNRPIDAQLYEQKMEHLQNMAGIYVMPESATQKICPVIMQVHTFYLPYLEDFYIKNPISAACSFDEQVNTLVRDGFSANHMIAPYLDQFGYETHLIIANNHHSQEQWARENAVILETSDNRLHEITRKQIETIKPDILYLSDPITFDSTFIRSLTWRPRLIMGWRAADIPQGTDWSEFDVMLSCLTGLRDAARRLGAKSTEHFFPGFTVWMNSQISAVQPCYDVVFAGSWTPEQHRSRNELLQAVADNSVGAYSCGYFLNSGNTQLPPPVSAINQGPRFGTEMYKALRSGRIVLDARARHLYFDQVSNQYVDMGRNETANMRIFEVTGCGSFLLTEFFDNLEDFFEIGKEIETFRDSDEMLRKIRYYLDHPDEREAIARRGQERCLRDYSMEKRTAEFDRIIQKHLAAKNFDIAISPTDVNEMLHRASGLLAAGDSSGAFGLLAKAKAGKQPISGIDLLRARCFLKMGQLEAAIEALREELRWFPENQDALRLLNELVQVVPNTSVSLIDDIELQQVLAQVRPYTMLSEQRLYSLYKLARSICENNIPGNFVECGVAAGGSSALLAWVIKKYSRQPRTLFAFDSFSGMPQPTNEDRHQGIDAEATGWGTGTCSAPEESVKAICTRLGVADVLVTVKGYFEETLPRMTNWVGVIALLHMDGDWYESTKSILENFYGQLSNNAIIQIDDYGYWDGCRKAIHEFEATHSTHFELKPIDGTGVWCVKPDCFSVNLSISASLIEDFLEDDPVPQGITTQMSANERFQLYYTIRTLNLEPVKVFRFVEIGSYGGGSLLLICRALKRRGMPFQGISIEPGGTPQFRQVLNLLGNSVIHLPMFSHEASRQLSSLFSATQPPGFILVDGDHTYQGVRQDIIDYYPLLAPGGTMLFHDYLPPLDERNREFIFAHHANTEPGIRQACLEMIEETYGLAPLDLPLLYPTDPAQTQAHLPIIPGVYSTIRGYQKPI